MPDLDHAPESEAAPAVRGRSPSIAAGLSFLWPGLGQMFLGRRISAAVLAVPALIVVALGVMQFSQGVAMFAASLWDPSYFFAVVAGVAFLAVLRVVAVGHAFVSGSPGRRPRAREATFLATLLVLIVAMHGAIAYGAWTWYDTSVSIQGNDLLAFAPDSGSTDDPYADPTPWPSDSSSPGPDESTSPTPRPSEPVAPTKPKNPNRITFLLVGIDSMPGRSHALTDTLIVVSLDKSTEKASIVSVPRDTANFDLYYGGWVGPLVKINTILSAASSPSFGSPDPPMKTLENEVGFLVGVPIDYYAAIDLVGFSKMIDAVGGVDVVNPKIINDPHTHLYVPAGAIHLDGPSALKYVRSREGAGDSDYTRSHRQQDVLMSLAHKISGSSIVGHLGTLLSLAGKYIATDFPLSSTRNYVSAAEKISIYDRCVLSAPYSYHPDSSTTRGVWTSRLDMGRMAGLSIEMFGQDSRYYGPYGAVPAACSS